MREWKKILHKWKEAGTFVPARMKKKNIIESSSPSMVYIIYSKNVKKVCLTFEINVKRTIYATNIAKYDENLSEFLPGFTKEKNQDRK